MSFPLVFRRKVLKLEGKVAVVTGAGAGIGEATAKLFAREGAGVCCNSLSESARRVAREIGDEGGKALYLRGDVSKTEDARRIIEESVAHFGRLDILFNNAGIVIPGTVDSMSVEDWDRTMAVNARGPFIVSKFALPELKKTRGCIVHNASIAAIKGIKDRAAYTASKGAVWAMTRAMAADCLGDGVRVNCICPGTTDTPSLAKRIAEFDDPAAAKAAFVARQPMGRLGTSEEMAEGVLYLVLAEFCSGIALSVDGGMTI
jgi:NAD(P)-dependent dehydrogenase (short-subunit alcohol dehydrogenase family)